MDAEIKYLGNDVSLISPLGDLDFLTVPVLDDAVGEALEQGARELIVDLTAITFIDSAGLAALLRARDRVRPRGGRVVLVTGSEMFLELLELTDFTSLFPIYDTPGAAIASAARPEGAGYTA